MKRGSTLTKSAIGLMLAGLAMCVFSLLWVGFNFGGIVNYLDTRYDDSVKVEYKAEGLNEITMLDLKTSNAKVVIKESETDDFAISYYENEDTKYTRSLENGVLRIERKDEFRFVFFNFGFAFDDEVVVNVPKGLKLNLRISSSNARIESKSQLTLGDVKLTTSNGKIELENASADGFDLKTSNGQIIIIGAEAKNEIIADTSNAAIEARNNAAGKIDLKTSNGRIEAEELAAKKVELKTSNGKIIGKFAGEDRDYALDIKTSNGKIEIDEREMGDSYYDRGEDGAAEIYAKTSNGSVELVFD